MKASPSYLARLVLVATTAALSLACSSDAPTVGGPDVSPVGPEALTVTLVRRPDAAGSTVATTTSIGVTVTARNLSSRPVRATLRCPAAGLALRVIAADGTLMHSSPTACRPEVYDGTVVTFAPGDSVSFQGSFGIGLPGAYRLRAVYEATEGSAPAVEQSVTVLAP